MFSCERVYPSVSSMRTLFGRSGTPSMADATAAPASRWRPMRPSSAAVDTHRPDPPIAVTTTVPSPGPSGVISPLVEQPTTGTPGAAPATPSASAAGSYPTAANTISSFGSAPTNARRAASAPAPRASAADERPTPIHRAPPDISSMTNHPFHRQPRHRAGRQDVARIDGAFSRPAAGDNLLAFMSLYLRVGSRRRLAGRNLGGPTMTYQSNPAPADDEEDDDGRGWWQFMLYGIALLDRKSTRLNSSHSQIS